MSNSLTNTLPEIINISIEPPKEIDTLLSNDQGPQGPRGIKGEDGKNATINGRNTLTLEAGANIKLKQSGDTLTISATSVGGGGTSGSGGVTSVNGQTGEVHLGANDITFEDGDTFQDKFRNGELKGEDGVTPNIIIGDVETLDPHKRATVKNVGSKEEPIFEFGIPRGRDGIGGGTGGGGLAMYAFEISEEGDLILKYEDGQAPPNITLDDEGNLIYEI